MRRLEKWRTDAESEGTARTEWTRLPPDLQAARAVGWTVLLLVALLLYLL